MNFLGHLFFSNDDIELMYYNLFGDYVKGSDLSAYPEKIQQGVLLHRNIDYFIDRHPTVLELFHSLYDELPKITGIAVDLLFDHLLARDWEQYHKLNLSDFVNEFYKYTPRHKDYFTDNYLFVLKKMKEQDWLFNYRTFKGITLTCERLSKRISFENNLSDAPAIFEKHRENIEKTFNLFMHDAILHFNRYYKSM